MRRTLYKPYVLLISLLFCLMSVPERVSEKTRSLVVSSISPCWRGLNFFKGKGLIRSQEDTERLSQENVILRSQIENIREWLLFEDRVQEQIERIQAVRSQSGTIPYAKEFFLRRSQEMCQALELQVQSLPARVVFREPASWSSTLWLNVGEKDNRALGKQVVAKNSPVLVGTSVVGVVEFVGERQSRIRLVTDAQLSPSVRAVRGKEQNRYLLEHVEALLFALEARDDLVFPEPVVKQLYTLQQTLKQQTGENYLAKGELYGTSSPLWRSRGQVLRGVGFNYDFADHEGPARDLRSGGILKMGDLLITTGLDGVFPAGLRVATVSKVQQLKEGASSYEIEAVSTAGNLDELNHVFVLPPVG